MHHNHPCTIINLFEQYDFLSVASWAWECPADSQAGACQHQQRYRRHHDEAEPRGQGSARRGDVADCDERGFGWVPPVPGDEGNGAAQREETSSRQRGKLGDQSSFIIIIMISTQLSNYQPPFLKSRAINIIIIFHPHLISASSCTKLVFL